MSTSANDQYSTNCKHDICIGTAVHQGPQGPQTPQGSILPFTGFDVGAPVVIGVGLTLLGLMFRKAAKTKFPGVGR